MDMMEIRRRMLMTSGKKVIDTTPIIEIYGKRQGAGNPTSTPPIDDDNSGITVFYDYEPVNYKRTMVRYVHYDRSIITLYTSDHSYMTYWSVGPKIRCLNPNSGAIKLDIYLPLIDDHYFYIKETGEILFAGKNTPYYGYTNINDMPTQKGTSMRQIFIVNATQVVTSESHPEGVKQK